MDMTLVQKFEFWLRAAYFYYWLDEPITCDYEWDLIGRELNANWSLWDHPFKYLVEKDAMYSAHYIKRDRYPEWAKNKNTLPSMVK